MYLTRVLSIFIYLFLDKSFVLGGSNQDCRAFWGTTTVSGKCFCQNPAGVKYRCLAQEGLQIPLKGYQTYINNNMTLDLIGTVFDINCHAAKRKWSQKVGWYNDCSLGRDPLTIKFYDNRIDPAYADIYEIKRCHDQTWSLMIGHDCEPLSNQLIEFDLDYKFPFYTV